MKCRLVELSVILFLFVNVALFARDEIVLQNNGTYIGCEDTYLKHHRTNEVPEWDTTNYSTEQLLLLSN